jgi:phosphoglycolate phosphatase
LPEQSVGFDLDMTLVDTRPGIRAALLALAEQTHREIDADAVVASLGPPVAEALAPWFSPDELMHAVALFRGHMAEVGVQDVAAMPGAAAALDAVRAAGLRVVVVTSKIGYLAEATLEHAKLSADIVAGDLFGEGKAAPLVEHQALAYVGDHPADMRAARTADIHGVGVTSGSSTERELLDAGADLVIGSLEQLDVSRLRNAARP